MYQTDQPTAVSSIPTPATAGTQGFFTGGNPGSGQAATIVDNDFLNMMMMELINVTEAGGLTPSKTTYNQVLLAIKALIAQPQTNLVSGVVGQVRNLFMQVTAASATATLTADEIIVESALGGSRYCLPSFSKTINLGTTGAGGMDAGTAPVSGFVALYAIFNPITSTAALLATNATSAKAPSVYGGANMPSGYTASGLVSVWPTNASGNFAFGAQRDRRIAHPNGIVYNSSTQVPTLTSLSIASQVPMNGVRCWGSWQATGGGIAAQVMGLASDSNGSGLVNIASTTSAGSITSGNSYGDMLIATPQTLWMQATQSGSGTPNFIIAILGYEI